MYALEYSTRVLRILQRLPEKTSYSLFTAIERLCENPRPKGSRRRRDNVFYIHVHADAELYLVGYEIYEKRVVVVVVSISALDA